VFYVVFPAQHVPRVEEHEQAAVHLFLVWVGDHSLVKWPEGTSPWLGLGAAAVEPTVFHLPEVPEEILVLGESHDPFSDVGSFERLIGIDRLVQLFNTAIAAVLCIWITIIIIIPHLRIQGLREESQS